MKSRPAQIIVADDDKTVRTVIVQALSRQGYQVGAATTIAGLWDITTSGRGNVLITDVGFPDGDALELLPRLQEKRPDLTIIVMSARANLLTAIKTRQSGVFDYLPKPFELKQLIDVVARAVTADPPGQALQKPALSLPRQLPIALMGKSPAMQMSFKLLTRLSGQNMPVLIKADIGSGKQTIAKTLHEMGPHAQDSFEAINLSQLEEARHEEALFGLSGLLTRRSAGMVFINHIELLSASAQMQLARFIENSDQAALSLPGNQLRIVAGTAVNLQALVEQGLFREDLFFELSVAVLFVPPLRERAEDIPQIAHLLCARLTEELGAEKTLDEEAVIALQGYEWPGNIRELELILKRLFLSAPQASLSAAIIAQEISQTGKAEPASQPEGESNLTDMFSQHIERYFAATGDASPVPGLHGRILAEVEKPLIMETLYHTAGNQIKAAHILGLNRNTLRKKIKELNIPSKREPYRNRGQKGQ